MAADRCSRATCDGCSTSRRCGHRGLLASVRMPMMMMPVMACRCGRRRAEQVIQNVNDSADISLRSAVSILKGRVQSAAERAGIDTLTMMMHTFYYRALPASRVLLKLKEYVKFLVAPRNVFFASYVRFNLQNRSKMFLYLRVVVCILIIKNFYEDIWSIS